MPVLGIIVFMALAWLMSVNKKAFPVRIVVWGVILQVALAFFVLNTGFGVSLFASVGNGFTTLLGYSKAGTLFLFGNMVKPEFFDTFGAQVALTIVPTIIFFSSLVSVLYHVGVMSRIVYAIAWVMNKTMGTSGPETLNAAANIFIGQTEAPILIRAYLDKSTNSEIQAIMVAGFATIASSVMGAYISFGISAQYLLFASILAAPGSLLMSKIAFPPEGNELTFNHISPRTERTASNILEAATNGAHDGLMLGLNVLAMLLAFIALVAVTDAGMGWIHQYVAWFPASLKDMFAYVFMPFAYLVGVPANEAHIFAKLFGTKIALNEFIAYKDLADLLKSGAVSTKTVTLCTIALCGFANISSIAIQIGGIGALAPSRRSDLAKVGWRSMALGALTNLMVTAIASLFL